MHLAGFDRRHAGNEPALDMLSAKYVRQIAGERAELDPFQIRSRRRKVWSVRLGPGRSQTIDDLKQQRCRCGSTHKGGIGAAIEISDPDAEHVMIEDRD